MTKSWCPAWGVTQHKVMLQNKCLAFEMTQNCYVCRDGDSFVRSGFLKPSYDWQFEQDDSLWRGLSCASRDVWQPWCTPSPIWNQSVVPCPVLTVASWSAYRFLRRQVRWSGIPSIEELSIVCCDPHSQSLEHSQWRTCFSEIFLLFLWSSGCWEFDIWFLCLF